MNVYLARVTLGPGGGGGGGGGIGQVVIVVFLSYLSVPHPV